MKEELDLKQLKLICKILAFMGSAGTIVALWEFWRIFIPASVLAFQASEVLGKLDPCRCFRIRCSENAARLKFPQRF